MLPDFILPTALLLSLAAAWHAHRQSRRANRLAGELASRDQAEHALRLAATAFQAQESMLITDARGCILQVNHAFCELTGLHAEDCLGKTPAVVKSGRHGQEFYQEMWAKITDTGLWQGEVWNRHPSGHEYPVWLTISAITEPGSGRITHYVGTHHDIGERRQALARIEELAFYDQLTGLPNRTLLLDRLKQTLLDCQRNRCLAALLFIDLDNFKKLNDTLGHAQGDLLLQQVAQRLQQTVRQGDTAARLGGDEFVVLLRALGNQTVGAATQAETVGEKILAALNQPYLLGAHSHHSSPSIGVTIFGDKPQRRSDIIKEADVAMYQAKAAGRNTLRFYDPVMQAGATARLAIERELRQAIQQDQLRLYLQAQWNAEGRCLGAEALVRWAHPERGLLLPAEFLPLASESGLIVAIGQWMLQASCRTLAEWQSDPTLSGLSISVNISSREWRQNDFVLHVLSILRQTQADAGKLVLELHDPALFAEPDGDCSRFDSLREKGLRFSIGAFGQPPVSLARLSRLPLHQIKLDRHLVGSLPESAAYATCRATLALGGALGVQVVADGVETLEQRKSLAQLGCTAFQGCALSAPVAVSAFSPTLTGTNGV